MYGYLSLPGARSMGEVMEAKLAIVSCPECSYLRDGECVVCVDGEAHPACDGCHSGELVWYRRPIFVSVVTSVAVSLIATLIATKIARRLDVVT